MREFKSCVFLSFLISLLLSLSAIAQTVPISSVTTRTFSQGWNMAGNSTTTPIDVVATFADQAVIVPITGKTRVISVWCWDNVNAVWAFYSPAFATPTDLSNYATAKGYQVLSVIAPGQGYWVNAAQSIIVTHAGAAPYSLSPSDLVKGWNLVSTGEFLTPAQLDTRLGGTAGAPSFNTMWVWSWGGANWYFYSPSLAANGSLNSYILSKGYTNIGLITTGNGQGFWLNSNITSTVPGVPTEVTAMAGNAQASVAFTPPTNNSGFTVSSYTVTSSPGGITATGVASPIIVSGLTNNTAYTFTVTATNISGSSLASSPSKSVIAIANLGPYYVDPVSGSNANPGTSTSPFKTITYALTAAKGVGTANTINASAGMYNVASGETFPLRMVNNVNLTGSGSTTTTIDGAEAYSDSSLSFRFITTLVIPPNVTSSVSGF